MLVLGINVRGYEESTHRALSYWAIRHRQSSVDRFLKEDLLWTEGIFRKAKASIINNECFGDCNLAKWLELGAEHEDDSRRPLRHFYNPLKNQGLYVPNILFPISRSLGCIEGLPSDFQCLDSLTWMWNGNDDDLTQIIVGGEDPIFLRELNSTSTKESTNLWSWKMARYYYFKSLVGFFSQPPTNTPESLYFTSRTSAEARTFYALGHIIHLLQDLAQPQHTRNDAHLHFTISGIDTSQIGLTDGAPMENYCGIRYGTPDSLKFLADQEEIPNFLLNFPFVPDKGKDDLPKELKLFWDTEQYQGKANWKHDNNFSPLGLSEYSNAYFVTDDTLPSAPYLPKGALAQIELSPKSHHIFPYPTFADTTLEVPASYNKLKVFLRGQRTDVESKRCGIETDYIYNNETTKSIFSYRINKILPNDYHYSINLCEANYEAQAQKLLPKAISYSTGILEYFFRGRLGVRVFPAETTEQQDATDCFLTITNLTTTKESLEGIDKIPVLSKYVENTVKTDPPPSIDDPNYNQKLREWAERRKKDGREIRSKSALWLLLEEDPLTKRQIPISFEAFAKNEESSGFKGRLQYGESFSAKAKLKRGRTYILIFQGTIGNEVQLAVAAKRFVFN